MADKIKCVGCEHCKDFRGYGNTRGSFHCDHPNKEYINKYFADHRIHKMQGFIGFGKPFEDKPSIKTSPAWCPKKAEDKADEV